MPSYLERDQLLPVQPHLANTDAIARTFQTKVQYWAAGAAQLKNAYQNYLGLELTRDDNQGRLSSYMQNANKILQSVSQRDLSVADNVSDALQVFDPIVKDKAIMGDNAITKHYRSQLGIAESYRFKDKGEGYSTDNVNYLMMKLNDFRTDQDPNNWQQHYSTRQNYTPYHDVAKEINTLMENFQPNVMDITKREVGKDGKNTMYMQHTVDKSRYAEQVRAYLSANLSDKAKKQLEITSVVRYGNNLDAIAMDYLPHANNQLKMLDKQIETLKGTLGAAKDADKQFIQNQIDAITKSRKSLESDVNNIKAGNYDFMKSNRDRFASFVYSDKYLDVVSRSLQNKDIKMELKPDQVEMLLFRESNENARFNTKLEFEARENQKDRDHETSLEMMRIASKNQKKDSTLDASPFLPNADESNEHVTSKDSFDKDLAAAQQSKIDAGNKLWKHAWDSFGPQYQQLSKDGRAAWVNTWLAKQQALPASKQDPFFKDYRAQIQAAEVDIQTLKATQATIEKEVNRVFGSNYSRLKNQYSALDKEYGTTFMGDAVGKDKVTVGNDFLANAIINGKVKKIGTYDANGTSYDTYEIDGKIVRDQRRGIGIVRSNLAAKIAKMQDILGDDNIKRLQKFQNDLYNENYVGQKYWLRPNDPDSDDIKAFRANIANRAASAGVKPENIGDIVYDGKGKVRFMVRPDDKKNIDMASVIKILGAGAKEVAGGYIELADENRFVISNSNDPELARFRSNLDVQLRTGNSGITPKGVWSPAGNGRYFRIRAHKGSNGTSYYPVIDNQAEGYPMFDMEFNSLEAVKKFVQKLATDPNYDKIVNAYK